MEKEKFLLLHQTNNNRRESLSQKSQSHARIGCNERISLLGVPTREKERDKRVGSDWGLVPIGDNLNSGQMKINQLHCTKQEIDNTKRRIELWCDTLDNHFRSSWITISSKYLHSSSYPRLKSANDNPLRTIPRQKSKPRNSWTFSDTESRHSFPGERERDQLYRGIAWQERIWTTNQCSD